MAEIETWGKWHSQALAAGVSAELAALGRAVVRDYWQHGHYQDEQAGDGPYLGADRHHQMMIALAKQKPELAKAAFEFALGDGSPQEEQLLHELGEAERRYADLTIACGTPDWYARVYALDGCMWSLYTEAKDDPVLYVYKCAECGHSGDVHLLDDQHDGKASTCKVCGAAVTLEWDGGGTFEVGQPK